MCLDFVEESREQEAPKQAWSIWSGDELLALKTPLFSRCVVALGTFDGVHVGHRRILSDAVRLAQKEGWPAVAVTFDRHPAATVAPHRVPPLITPFQRRLELIVAAGISHIIVIRFDADFCRMPAEEFVRQIIGRALGAKALVVGYDFRFGFGARGNVATLEQAAPELGYDLNVVPPVTVDGERVSSTLIRRRVGEGDVEGVRKFLGRPFGLQGTVVSGDARGRTLGFPTANLQVDPELLVPGDGVYLTRVRPARSVDPNVVSSGDCFAALTVIGTRPSFGGGERTVESFLLDFDGDLYGRQLVIDFHRRVRGIIRFRSAEELVRQIEADVAKARAYFGLGNPR